MLFDHPESLLITILLAPIVLSYYWKIPLYTFIPSFSSSFFSNPCLHIHSIYCPSNQAPTLYDAIILAKSSYWPIFQTRRYNQIILTSTDPDVYHTERRIDFDRSLKLVVMKSSSLIMKNGGANPNPNPTISSSGGIYVSGIHTHIKFQHVNVTRGKGISSIRGGMLEMERCHIYGCKSSGLICRSGGTAELVDCESCMTIREAVWSVVKVERR